VRHGPLVLTDSDRLFESVRIRAFLTTTAASSATNKRQSASKKLKAEHPLVAADDIVHAAVTAAPAVEGMASSAKSTPSLSRRVLSPDGQEGDGYLYHMLSFGSVDSNLFRMDSRDGSFALSRMHSLLPPPPQFSPATKAKSMLQTPQDATRV